MPRKILTKEQAIDAHREAWNYVAKKCEQGNLTGIHSVSRMLSEYCEAHNISCDDPCCAYDRQIRELTGQTTMPSKNCHYCPIKWGTESSHMSLYCCADGLGLYAIAQDASHQKDWNTVKEIAIIIANLPEHLPEDYENKNTETEVERIWNFY